MRVWWVPWAVYGPLAGLGAAWAAWAHGSAWRHPEGSWLPLPWGTPNLVGAALAILLAVATIGATRLLVQHTDWARRLHVEFRAALLDTPASQLFVLALTSAFGEELFFRAALQPTIGLMPSAVLFGVVHVAPNGNWLTWGTWATVMGVAFGALYAATGTILAPVLAHAVINYENMQYICNYDPTPLDTGGGRPT